MGGVGGMELARIDRAIDGAGKAGTKRQNVPFSRLVVVVLLEHSAEC